ncbi:MAG: lipoate--protein ligase family protein [Candidatus Binatia bacterium]
MPTPNENLACDEALLDECVETQGPEVLRFWEPRELFIVLGYSSRIRSEVNGSCDNGIPVLRRCSGGGTVLQGPGCLNYALVLKIAEGAAFSGVTQTNAAIMTKIHRALEPLVRGTMEIQGTSDLTLNGAKFCGNAQRRKKGFLLFHGVLLLEMNLDLIEKHLPVPAKQPRYRQNRAHKDFLANLKLPGGTIKQALRRQWNAGDERRAISRARVERLVKNQYATEEWIRKF